MPNDSSTIFLTFWLTFLVLFYLVWDKEHSSDAKIKDQISPHSQDKERIYLSLASLKKLEI